VHAQPVLGHGISDVYQSLRNAQDAYECRVQLKTDAFQAIAPTTTAFAFSNPTTPLSKSKAKLRLWLTGLSEKIMYYSNVFDVMVQHHPEYVSLAWGTFKLIFIVSAKPPNTYRLNISSVMHLVRIEKEKKSF